MSNSYFRNCKWCGQRIHMREMPYGQWVAFDGPESVHDCDQESEYNNLVTQSSHSAGGRSAGPGTMWVVLILLSIAVIILALVCGK
jgi:hypothetical protein